MEKKLVIKLGEEYKAKIQSVENFENSIFNDIYEKAFSNISEIIKNNLYDDKNSYENYNNIVAFVGERGTGKTSCMLSVSKALKNLEKLPEKYNKKINNENLKDYVFQEVGIIDPSLFSKNSNIMEIIIAKMFSKFKEKIEDSNSENIDHDKKRKLISAFETVYDNLKTINDENKVFEEGSLDALLKLSATVNLKENIQKLINSYLDFMNKNNHKHTKLLLEIDDIDLNTKHAYEMVEQIRKYFIIPNIIILIAVKLEQLSLIIERNYRTEFQNLSNLEEIGSFFKNDSLSMSEKYLEKLIPLERRLYLPSMRELSLSTKLIINKDKEDTNYNTISKGVRELIYETTELVFLEKHEKEDFLFPITLRGLIELIIFLYHMKENEENEKEKEENKKEKNKKNLHDFEKYFIEKWCHANLSDGFRILLKEIYNKNYYERNKFLVTKLEQVFGLLEGKNGKEKISTDKEYYYITISDNDATKISLGDVLYCINTIERNYSESDVVKFTFALKILYSILLKKYSLEYNKENIEFKDSKYSKFIGNSICNPSYNSGLVFKEDYPVNEIYIYNENETLREYFGTNINFKKRKTYRIQTNRTPSNNNLQLNLFNILIKPKFIDDLYITNIDLLEEILKTNVETTFHFPTIKDIEKFLLKLKKFEIELPNGNKFKLEKIDTFFKENIDDLSEQKFLTCFFTKYEYEIINELMIMRRLITIFLLKKNINEIQFKESNNFQTFINEIESFMGKLNSKSFFSDKVFLNKNLIEIINKIIEENDRERSITEFLKSNDFKEIDILYKKFIFENKEKIENSKELYGEINE